MKGFSICWWRVVTSKRNFLCKFRSFAKYLQYLKVVLRKRRYANMKFSEDSGIEIVKK